MSRGLYVVTDAPSSVTALGVLCSQTLLVDGRRHYSGLHADGRLFVRAIEVAGGWRVQAESYALAGRATWCVFGDGATLAAAADSARTAFGELMYSLADTAMSLENGEVRR